VVHPLKNILNGLRWDAREEPDNYVITYRHRGAPDDVMRILASRIARLGKSYFTIKSESDAEETLIPFHRVLEVRNLADDSIIWVSRKH